MKAYDVSYPEQTSTATVAIEVSRNDAAPIFSSDTDYNTEIAENHQLGSSVLQLQAEDLDEVSR